MNANEIVNVLRACGNGNSVCEKCPFYIREDSNECRFNAIYESADTIEAQQQEIDRLTNLSELGAAIVEHQSQILEALTADKDEQAGRIMQYESALKNMYFAYQNKDPDCPHDFEIKAIEQYNALLGGKEDEK